MTREEALFKAKDVLDEATAYEDAVCYVTGDDREWLELAIKALEQEPCDYYDTEIKTCRRSEVPPETEWIPVSERLPNKLKDVLIAFEDCPNEYDVAYLRTTFNKSYKKNGAKNEWVSSMGEATYADYEVSAWMLIEPYKAESEE